LLDASAKGYPPSRYNLACLEAICGDANKSASWLRSAVEAGYRVTKTEVASESDFDAIRHDPVFVEFLSGLPEK
jgi:hypothetical protein